MAKDRHGRGWAECFARTVWLFVRLVFREWHEVRLWPNLAWQISAGIWLTDFKAKPQ